MAGEREIEALALTYNGDWCSGWPWEWRVAWARRQIEAAERVREQENDL